MKFYNAAEIGTADVVLYEVPATLEASIPVLFFHNKTGSAVDLTLKVYDHSNVATGNIWPEQIAADGKFVFSRALLLNEGDKLIASASVDASIDATLCGISSMAVPISGPLNPLGDWNSVTDYVVRDLAFDDDTSWICVTPNTNSQPSLVNPNWMVLAKQGIAGVAGFEADGSIPATGDFNMGGNALVDLSLINGVSALGQPHAILEEQYASGTDAGTFASGSWVVRKLNAEAYNPYSLISVNGINEFTAAFDAFVIWSAPAYQVGNHKSRIFNVTDSAEVRVSENSYMAASAATQTRSVGWAILDAGKGHRVEHWAPITSVAFGLGVGSNLGTEIYTTLHVWKI